MANNTPSSSSSTPQELSTPSSNSTIPSRPDLIISSGTSIPPEPRRQANYADALSTLPSADLSRLTHISEIPCARSAFLTGITAGFLIGGAILVIRGPSHTWNASSWAVGTWATGSLGGFAFCQKQKQMEQAGMRRAMEIMEAKKKEKDGAMMEAREEMRRRRREKEERERERASRWGPDWRGWFREADKEGKSEGERGRIEEEVRRWEESKREEAGMAGPARKEEREVKNVTKSRAAGEW